MFDLYLITPDLAPELILAHCARALAGAPHARVALQLRSKQLDAHARRALAIALRGSTRAHGAALIINGDAALACEVGADGVQMPEQARDLAGARTALDAQMLLGASRHDLQGVLAAAEAGAAFATLSPIFDVPDKGQPLGLAGLAEVAARTALPLFALGGIDDQRAYEAVRAGAHGVAVIRHVWDSADAADAVAQLLAAVDAGRAARSQSRS